MVISTHYKNWRIQNSNIHKLLVTVSITQCNLPENIFNTTNRAIYLPENIPHDYSHVLYVIV